MGIREGVAPALKQGRPTAEEKENNVAHCLPNQTADHILARLKRDGLIAVNMQVGIAF